MTVLLAKLLAMFGLWVNVTFYTPDSCWDANCTTFSGYPARVGWVACSWNLPIGTVLRMPNSEEVVCMDRGLLGCRGWVDFFVPYWRYGIDHVENVHGRQAYVEVVSWGEGQVGHPSCVA